MKKDIILYTIYSNRTVSRKGDILSVRTEVSFTTPEEARKYCDLLNQREIAPTLIKYTFKREHQRIFKKAEELNCDPIEDKNLLT